MRRNDVDAATAALDRALGPAAGRTDADYEGLSDELGEEENAEGVTRVLSRVTANSPESPALRMTLATAALRSGDFDLAIDSAQRAIGKAPGPDAGGDFTDEANALIGRALLSRGDTDAALDHMARQVEARPSLDLTLEYARLLAAADRQTEAICPDRRCGKAFRRGSGGAPAAGAHRVRYRRHEGGVGRVRQSARGKTNTRTRAVFTWPRSSMKQQRFDQALQLFARIQEAPYLLPAQDAMARIAEASGDTQSAMQLLTGLAKRRPELAFDVARYRAAMLQRMGQDQEALAIFDDILTYRPDDVNVLLARGALLEKMNRLDPALADMERAVTLMPDNAVAVNALGYTLANRTHRYPEAYRLIRRALEREPESAAIIDSYGWVLYRQGRLAEARSYLQLANSQLPDPEVAAHLGEVMWKQGDQDAARQLWTDALEKDPGSQPLKDTMARFVK